MSYYDSNQPLTTLLPAIRSMLRDPAGFFRNLPDHAYYRDAIFLLSLTILVDALISAPFYGLAMLFLFPVIWGAFLASAWLWAAYLRWAVRTIARLPLGKVAALEIVAYGSVPLAISGLPYLGILGLIGSLYLQGQALIHRARVNPATAWMIVVLPSLALIGLLAALWVAVMATVFHLPATS